MRYRAGKVMGVRAGLPRAGLPRGWQLQHTAAVRARCALFHVDCRLLVSILIVRSRRGRKAFCIVPEPHLGNFMDQMRSLLHESKTTGRAVYLDSATPLPRGEHASDAGHKLSLTHGSRRGSVNRWSTLL